MLVVLDKIRNIELKTLSAVEAAGGGVFEIVFAVAVFVSEWETAEGNSADEYDDDSGGKGPKDGVDDCEYDREREGDTEDRWNPSEWDDGDDDREGDGEYYYIDQDG